MEPKGNDILIKNSDSIIAYDDKGSGSMPIIFIHGFPFDRQSWRPQLEYFKDKTRTITYDIRGYGASVSGDENLSIRLFADDLIALMDLLQIEKAIVCGLSMGGYIALNAVSRYEERFEKLILCGTQCHSDTDEGKEKRYKTIKLIRNGGFSDWAAGMVKNLFSPMSHERNLDSIGEIQNSVNSASQKVVVKTLEALAERDETCFYLPMIKIPVLIIAGKEDTVIPVSRSEYMHEMIKHSEFHFIEEAGHLVNLEKPEEFNRLVEKFIN